MARAARGTTVGETEILGGVMFDKVLVGVDGRSGGRDAIALALQLAASPSRLVFANVYRGARLAGRTASVALPDERDRAHSLVTRARLNNSLEGETVVHCDFSPGRGLHELAEREGADLLVVGSSHRGGIGRVLLGDGTLDALGGAPCAVAIAPQGYASADRRWSTIGVGDDGSAQSAMAIDVARRLAARHGTTIRVRSVVPLQGIPPAVPVPLDWTDATDRAIRAERQRLAAIEGIDGEVVVGRAGEELGHLGAEVQLLLVGSRGYGPVGRMLHGSTSHHLARHCHCPLLVLPHSSGLLHPSNP